MDLVICMSSDDVLYLYQVSQKYLRGFQNYETDNKIYKGAYFRKKKNIGLVTDLIFCTSTDNSLYMYQVSWIYL